MKIMSEVKSGVAEKRIRKTLFIYCYCYALNLAIVNLIMQSSCQNFLKLPLRLPTYVFG